MKTENYTVPAVKAFLKELAIMIRILKQLRKEEQNQHLQHIPADVIERARAESLDTLRYQARHYHIAYSEFRGRERNQIENKANTKADESLIAQIKTAMTEVNPLRVEVADA
jgi:hypothetical protein